MRIVSPIWLRRKNEFAIATLSLPCGIVLDSYRPTTNTAMSLLSLIAALLLEQFHPLATRKYLFTWMNSYADFFQHHFNAGVKAQEGIEF